FRSRMQNMRSITKTNVHQSVCVAALAALTLVLTGCGQKDQRLDRGKAETSVSSTQHAAATVSSSPTLSDFPVPPKPADASALVARGEEVYAQNCASCHGEKGDG